MGKTRKSHSRGVKDEIEECADTMRQLENAVKRGRPLYSMPFSEAQCYLNKMADRETERLVLLPLF